MGRKKMINLFLNQPELEIQATDAAKPVIGMQNIAPKTHKIFGP